MFLMFLIKWLEVIIFYVDSVLVVIFEGNVIGFFDFIVKD